MITQYNENKVHGEWVNYGKDYRITIKKLHKGQASVRDDTLSLIKERKGSLQIIVEGWGTCLEIPYDKIDKSILWRQGPMPSKIGRPYYFCYFSVKKPEANQGRLF